MTATPFHQTMRAVSACTGLLSLLLLVAGCSREKPFAAELRIDSVHGFPTPSPRVASTPAPADVPDNTQAPKTTPTAEALRVGGDVTAPVAITSPSLHIPQGVPPGVVILEGVITTEGRVKNVRVIKSSSKGAGEVAIGAMRAWRYKPATQAGKPVPVYLTIVVRLCA